METGKNEELHNIYFYFSAYAPGNLVIPYNIINEGISTLHSIVLTINIQFSREHSDGKVVGE